MTEWTSVAPTVFASFMASMVEFVEALTIVLAVGIVRGWRSALLGTGAALSLLVALVVFLGPALTLIPLQMVQLVVGTLLLMFGLRWLRKAILRSAGLLPLHDEAKAFTEKAAALSKADRQEGRLFDKLAFGTSFKIVMLEGIEVVFIVIAIGAGGKKLIPAAVGALLALLAVVFLGLWLHKPLTRVPENMLKFVVGVLLSAFGTFWAGEGIGLEWPGADWAAVGLVAVFLGLSFGLIKFCTYLNRLGDLKIKPEKSSKTSNPSPIGIVLSTLVGLFVDDGWLATAIAVWVLTTWVVRIQWAIGAPVSSLVFSSGVAVALISSVLRFARRST